MVDLLGGQCPKCSKLKSYLDDLLDHNNDLSHQPDWGQGEWVAFNEIFRPSHPIESKTSRTKAELFILNKVCSKYTELFLTERQKVQYVEIGTYQGASAIAACLNNSDILSITIDSYDDSAYQKYENNHKEKAQSYIEQLGNQKIKMITERSDSPNLQKQIMEVEGFNASQGINVFFYDGFDARDGDEGDIIGKTFENILPLCSEFSVWIINKYDTRTYKDEGKSYIKNAFEDKVKFNLGEVSVYQYTPKPEFKIGFEVKYIFKEESS